MKRFKKNKQVFYCILTLSSFFLGCHEKDFVSEENNESVLLTQNTSSNLISGTIAFEQSGPVGGGYPNVVTWDPNDPNKVYFGSDIGGTGVSTNYGKSFKTKCKGLGYQDSHQKIATLNAIDVNGSTVIVGGTGFKGIGGEVISSTDNGDSWNVDSSDISFSAQNSNVPLPTGRPRSTDASLIQWVSGSTWVAGTYKDGVWISTNNRSSWTKINNVFNSGAVHVRAMAMSPNDPNAVYVGLWGDDSSIPNKGLWLISGLNTSSPSGTQISNIPDVVESIVVLGNRLYLACGRFGVRRYVPSNGNLSDITGSIGTSVMSTAISGYERNWNTDRVVVGTADGDGDIWLSEDSGTTWTNTTASGVSNTPWDGTQDLLVFQKHGNWALGKSNCDIASIQVSPHDNRKWVVCSTSAIWTTHDSGVTWKPANGFQILTYRDVDINQSGVIAVGNTDHDLVTSSDGGANWYSAGLGGVTTGHGITFSPDGSEVALAANERDNNTTAGKFGIVSSLSSSSPIVDEVTGTPSPKRIIGCSWVEFPGGTERIIAAVDDGEIITSDRPSNSNNFSTNWVSRSTPAFTNLQSNNGLRCSVVTNGTTTTFMYDRLTGVWRTTDYGVSWTKILTKPVGKDEGYLAYDSSNDILYVSTDEDVFRIANASVGGSPSEVNLNYPKDNPGAMALDPSGRLLVYARPENASNPDCFLYRLNNPHNTQNGWLDKADDTLREVAATAIDMSASDDYIVIVTDGKGLLISSND
ncbi:hypothetical protein FPF71_08900 [Algibacter amylolyticus]|uniref:Uncharacterized protein n=1 Tax=Algibacter amylolyticus TaxID=1608400 RepID=A0A5M7B638_9FLAO|nr:hypothetical protein [Algibacter amylolyticus]KAA5824789.1 hypothetical protein F2B50_08900 [Algibacter amylolyticus]MBB5268906.1 hypothetical protein [Algibacter amylolyticus]TSJ75954.1 hypothetical protein FPF71_08900 [Algibacter amylolyticus]